ncbi:hypothetical protein CRE_22922 [Caenorhabditis remanei]|uniref:Uncharacterized protein n=1 Tax=Caenorhabditis remanei TaxID=31234 RepID=E3MW51_CAERE|nr:hypothetical protein CRE_22922 [Caenorhabditis remanei]
MKPNFNIDLLDGMLYTLHSLKFEPHIAHNHIAKMFGEEPLSLREVYEFWMRMEQKEMKLENGHLVKDAWLSPLVVLVLYPPKLQKPTKWAPRPTLTDVLDKIPPNVLVDQMDFGTRMACRNASYRFRQAIDHTRWYIDEISLLFNTEYVELETSDGFHLSFEFVDGGMIHRCQGRMKLIETRDVYENFRIIQPKLVKILDDPKLKIGTLRIDEYKNYSNYRLSGYLEPMTRHFNADHVELIGHIGPQSFAFLTKIQFLNIQTFCHHNVDPDQVPWQYSMQTAQLWRNMKELRISGCTGNLRSIVENWWNMEFVRFEWFNGENGQSIHDDVMVLKENLFRNPNLNQFIIYTPDMPLSDFDALNTTLQTYNFIGSHNWTWAHFRYPGAPENTLSVMVATDFIWFKGPRFEADWDEMVNGMMLDLQWAPEAPPEVVLPWHVAFLIDVVAPEDVEEWSDAESEFPSEKEIYYDTNDSLDNENPSEIYNDTSEI